MRRNRRVPKKMSVVATNSMRFAAIIVVFVVMVILNLLSSQGCKQLENVKGTLEREIAKLDDARERESSRWDEMKTAENIERALLRHGLSMKVPRGDQTVCLMADGRPRPGQLSLARAKARGGLATAVAVQKQTSRTPYRRKRSVR